MTTESITVYVEHPKNNLQDIACDTPGWESTHNACSGAHHEFTTVQSALKFIWKIRYKSARYVEMKKEYIPDLQLFAKNKGFDNIDGLISKFI